MKYASVIYKVFRCLSELDVCFDRKVERIAIFQETRRMAFDLPLNKPFIQMRLQQDTYAISYGASIGFYLHRKLNSVSRVSLSIYRKTRPSKSFQVGSGNFYPITNIVEKHSTKYLKYVIKNTKYVSGCKS